MPDEDDPASRTWGPAIRREVAALADGAVVVGHSLGGTLLVRALVDLALPQDLAAIVLVGAPFVGAGGWPSDEFELPPDLGARLPHSLEVHVVHGLGDTTVPPSHAELYAGVIARARLLLLPGRDHQLHQDLSEVATLIRQLPQRHEDPVGPPRRPRNPPGAAASGAVRSGCAGDRPAP